MIKMIQTYLVTVHQNFILFRNLFAEMWVLSENSTKNDIQISWNWK